MSSIKNDNTNIRPTSKRDRSGNKYRYSPMLTPVSPAPDKEDYRAQLKPWLGKLVTAHAVYTDYGDPDFCKVSDCIITHDSDYVAVSYVWVRKRRFVQANLPDRALVTFTARVRVYNSGGKIKYGLIPISILGV